MKSGRIHPKNINGLCTLDTNEKEFLEQFAFIEGTEPLRYQNYLTYKNKNYYLMEITGN